MNERLLEAVRRVSEQRERAFAVLGPNARKRYARSIFVNSDMARYTVDGEFVWLPQFGGPDYATAASRQQ